MRLFPLLFTTEHLAGYGHALGIDPDMLIRAAVAEQNHMGLTVLVGSDIRIPV